MKRLTKFIFIFLLFPLTATAHGVGQVYSLPIPLKYYLFSSGLAVVCSFFLFTWFGESPSLNQAETKTRRVKYLNVMLEVVRVVVLILFLLMVATGIFGNPSGSLNFAPTFFWIYFLLGFGIASVLVGNIWDKLSPFKQIVSWFNFSGQIRKISPWTGVVLVLGLYWLELASGLSFLPKLLGGLLLIYLGLNILLASVFRNWFEDAELFSVLFGFIGKLAPWRIGDDNKTLVRLPIGNRIAGASHAPALVLAAILLAATSFDSFKETVLWFRLIDFYKASASLRLPNTFGLILFPLPFILLYLLAVYLMKLISKHNSFKHLALVFVFPLIPIAFGYTIAHNFALFLTSLPQMIGLFSDPFGWKWDLFGTASNLNNSGWVPGAKFIWFAEITFVVIAHIMGTYFAHRISEREITDQSRSKPSQYPMLLLMVIYTMITLWLLSKPLVV